MVPAAADITGTDEVVYATDEGIATITMNRPERRNALSLALITGLRAAITAAAEDPDVRAVVLTGAGGNFCVGRDQSGDASTKRIVQGESPSGDRMRLLEVSALIQILVTLPKATVASIRGGCAGAGLSLALACDLRYADTAARFSTAFVGAGMSGDLGMAWSLTRAVGPSKARELMLLSERFGADLAAQCGLVHEAVSNDDVDRRTREVALRLASSAPLAVGGAKANLNAALFRPLGDYLTDEVDRLVACAYSADAEEARLAFLEKRAPIFTGASPHS